MSSDIRVPFNRMRALGREESLVIEALRSGHLSANGSYTQRCERILEEVTWAKSALLTTSATDALEIGVRLLDLGPGDEVIMPSFTFVSTANAVCLAGATPRFVDIEPDTLNIDPEAVASAIGSRTKAIIPVHYAGVGCDMDRLRDISEHHGLPILEDAAQGISSSYKGRPLGSFGSMAALSFHETKNIGCGEGGALLVNDEALVDRAHAQREKGTNRKAFQEGRVDKYTWVELGSSHGLAEPLAAYLLGQLEMLETATRRRVKIHDRYMVAFKDLEQEGKLRLPRIPSDCSSNGHLFYLLLRSPDERSAFIRSLSERGVASVFHYVPLHSSSMGQQVGLSPDELPVTDDLSSRLARLPIYATLTDEEQDHVIEAVRAHFAESRSWN